MYTLLVLLLTVSDIYCASIRINNVCRTFKAYANIQMNRNCYHNPDVESTPYQIAKRYGFLIENHEVITEDGYILTIFRLLNMERNPEENRQPVVIQHGILVDGLFWMISGNESFAFYLADAGLDVWLINSRGTRYSSKHNNPAISLKDYWDFSFHELGAYDLPAVIEKISEQTERNDIIHIGHSMGTTAAVVYSIVKKNHAEKFIKGFIQLAPIVNMYNIQGLALISSKFYELFSLTDALGIHSVSQLSGLKKLVVNLCSRYPLVLPCQIIEALGSGLVVEQIRPDMLPVILTNFLLGTSTKIFKHYTQIVLSKGRFQWFDYGPVKNLQLYNSTLPPEYDVTKITLPTHLFTGRQDFLAAEEDVKYFYKNLRCPKSLHIYDLAHNNFAFGSRVRKTYDDISAVINNKLVGKSNKTSYN